MPHGTIGNIWSFDTPRFRVRVDAYPEFESPVGQFDDGGQAEREIESGDLEWFRVRAAVVFKGPHSEAVLGESHLGGCAYRRIEDFRDHVGVAALSRQATEERTDGLRVCVGSYFSDMVREAISQARETKQALAAA